MFKSLITALNSISFPHLFVLFLFSAFFFGTSLIPLENDSEKSSIKCSNVYLLIDSQKIKTEICYNNQTIIRVRDVQQ